MKKLLILGVVVLSFAFATSVFAASPTDLVGWWKLDQNAGDSSGNSLNGTFVGIPDWQLHTDFGHANNFNGSSYVEVPDNALLEPVDTITVEAWVKKLGSPGGAKYIVSKYLPNRYGSYSSYGLYTGGGGLRFYVGKTSGWTASPEALASVVWNGEWHHVAGTFDGTNVKLYVDGIQVVGSGSTIEDIYYYGTGNLYIGSYTNSSYLAFNGLIDEVKIWNKALTAGESLDYDMDGDLNEDDNCPWVANPGQEDLDENGIGNVCDARYGVIVSPAANEHILGNLNLLAYLVDNDQDPVSWAVRRDSCAAATNTVISNVGEGQSVPYSWTYNPVIDLHTFSATVNTCNWQPGIYYHCFIFNPSEDGGEADIRLTRQFFIDACDSDGDGSSDYLDCNDNDATIHPNAPDAACNGIDNDCDLAIDEGYVATQTQCGIGACASTGMLQCISGVEVDSCTAGIAGTETCDNADNDCDGSTDEDLSRPAENQLGPCLDNTEFCSAGSWVANSGNYIPTAEICTNGLDEDCDGTVNDGCYQWSGFFQPVDMNGVLNQVKAGSAIPVKFSLGGNMSLNIFAPGYPNSQQIECNSTALIDTIETTVTAGGSSLTYDPIANQYIYVWKTQKSWANTCRQLTVKLIDDTIHTANFKFK